MSDPKPRLRIAIDIGGTFTDLVAYDDSSGAVFETKTSTVPADFAAGAMTAIELGGFDPAAVAMLVHGSTVVINAVTQRRGAVTALVTTAGFRDVLEIGRGNRPDMYNLKFHKPQPFVPRRRRFEVAERVLADGTVRTPLDRDELETIAERCRTEGVEAVAICFLHAYAHPEHERQAKAILADRLPGVAITASSDITTEWREFERSSTAVLNAYVQPVLDRYLAAFEERLDAQGVAGRRFAMLSNGGTATFATARQQPIQMVESGPAGGIIGAALVGAAIGEPDVISLDIGGTTAKCSLIENGDPKITGDYRLEWTPLSPGYPVRVPVVDIVEIGAGGGSIAWFDEGGALRVGPLSAGADPGPACYGIGGTQPTVTDAMLICGVIDPDRFLDGRLKLDVELAQAAFEPIATRLGVTVEEAAAGVIRLVNAATIDALKLVSVRRGHDPRDFSLIAFGGGGPMHAGMLAGELGVKQVVVPPFPGTFSAWGMLVSRPRIDRTLTRVTKLELAVPEDLEAVFDELERSTAASLAGEGFEPDSIVHQRAADMRYHGQEHTVRVAIARGSLDLGWLRSEFDRLHHKNYTFSLERTPVEIVNFRTVSAVELERPHLTGIGERGGSSAGLSFSTRRVLFESGSRVETRVYRRIELPAGFRADGPAIVEEPSATTVVPPGCGLAVDRFGNLLIRASAT